MLVSEAVLRSATAGRTLPFPKYNLGTRNLREQGRQTDGIGDPGYN